MKTKQNKIFLVENGLRVQFWIVKKVDYGFGLEKDNYQVKREVQLTPKELELIKDLVEEQYRNVPRDEWKALLKKLEGLK